jgi:SlyX protein
MESRITDLEIRLAHQEAAIDELTRTVMQQRKIIAEISNELELLKSMLREVAPSPVAPASEEQPPPHY